MSEKQAFTREQLALFREWFEVAVDNTPDGYMNKEDYKLAVKLYEHLGMRVPHSCLEGAGLPVPIPRA